MQKNSNNVIVLGTQWGDEGKGKLVDWLTRSARVVVRFQGGDNAGHTLIINGKKTVLRLLPSGIMHEGVMSVLGNGMVISPVSLLSEVQALQAQNVPVLERLRISQAAQVLLPYHIMLDTAREEAGPVHAAGHQKRAAALQATAIGTTRRGIGPAYEDKAARRGIRVAELLCPDTFEQKLNVLADYYNFLLTQYYQLDPIDPRPVMEQTLAAIAPLRACIVDTVAFLETHHRQGAPLLFEGAQGTLLDIDHGTYPYVTSSNTVAGAASCGSGLGPVHMDCVLGAVKAYSTRVGGGPFPTELTDDTGRILAERGHEFGCVTGRPRRCGWLDIVMLRRSLYINSVTALCVTKLDVLDTLATVKLCVGYESATGDRVTFAPQDVAQLHQYTPIYETLPGWQCATWGVTDYQDLPTNAKRYIDRISALTGVPVQLISTGAEREQMIVRSHPFSH